MGAGNRIQRGEKPTRQTTSLSRAGLIRRRPKSFKTFTIQRNVREQCYNTSWRTCPAVSVDQQMICRAVIPRQQTSREHAKRFGSGW
eukprot:16162454-Heterocapsa_arctica.AAC.1